MPRRPATTVLLLTRHLIARADFTRDHTLLELSTQPRPDVQEWPTLVEVALGLGAKPGGKTYVLCSDLWTQTLPLNNISTQKMAADEVAAALNFEAETLSGQSAFESLVAAQALPTGNDYWIVQPRMADFAQAEHIVHEAGSTLAGLGHPGGLPQALNKSSQAPDRPAGKPDLPAPWTRIEFWPDAVLFLRGDAQDSVQVHVVNADPQTGRWKADWEAWRKDSAGTQPPEALVGPGVVAAVPTLARAMTLETEADLSAWLAAWAKQLDGKPVRAPFLRPAKKPMGTTQRWAIGVGLAALVLLCCGSLHYWLEKNLTTAGTELKQIQAQNKQLTDLQKQADEIRVKQKELQGQIAGMETSLKVLATHRLRLSRFLTKMSDLYPEHLYVEKMDIVNGEPHLRGHCLRPELADQFANQLALALAEQGWDLHPSNKAALKKADDGAPWSFDIALTSANDMKLDTRVEPKTGIKRK